MELCKIRSLGHAMNKVGLVVIGYTTFITQTAPWGDHKVLSIDTLSYNVKWFSRILSTLKIKMNCIYSMETLPIFN